MMPPSYFQAAAVRRADRSRCDWPEVAIVGDAGTSSVIALAASLRRNGVATATYFVPVRRQLAKAKADQADFVVFADTLQMRDLLTGCQWQLNRNSPAEGVIFACVCGYLPVFADSPAR